MAPAGRSALTSGVVAYPPVPVLPADPAAPPPWLAEHYEHLGVLGGHGAVHRMRERATGREVAVKLAADDAARAQLAREASLAARLRHANVVEVRAVAGPAGDRVLVSPYLSGGTLRAAAESARSAAGADARAPLGYARVAAVLRDVAAALAHAHAQGVVHADVKPENVLFDAGGRALLADFGIAHEVGRPDRTAAEAPAGTPAYMAPEHVAGAPLDARADVYALGLVGWELLAGRRPWEGLAVDAVLHAQRTETLPALAELCPDVPAYLLAAIEGALAKDPAARWPDAGVMLRRLSPVPRSLPAAPCPDPTAAHAATMRLTTSPPVRAPARRRRWAGRAALAAATVLGVAGLLPAMRDGGAASRSGDARPAAPRRAAVAYGEVALTPVARPRAADPPRAEASAELVAPAVAGPCGTATAAAQHACARARTGAADEHVASAVAALAAAMRAAAPAGWEPAAVRQLHAEQARWATEGRRACPGPNGDDSSAMWGAARGGCLAERAERRTAELRARRARFSPSADGVEKAPE